MDNTTSKSMSSQDDIMQYVTRRKYNRQLNISNTDESMMSSKSENIRARSLPDLSTCCDETMEELREEINTLKIQLDSANSEIDKLILENTNLEKKIISLEYKLKTFNKITSSPLVSPRNPNTSTIKKPTRRITRTMFTQETELSKSSTSEVKTNLPTTNILHTNNINITELSGNINQSSGEGSIKKRKIFILGGQQCVGLVSELIDSRKNTQFEDFEIFSWTKPYAKTEDILMGCYNIEDSKSNYFILCVGENDTNVTKIFFETAAVIKMMKNSNFIIVNVNHNIHLNKFKLNNMLKTLCYNTPNCKFIHCTGRFKTT